MPEKKKSAQDRWFVAVIAGLVFIGLAIWASVLVPMDKTPVENTKNAGEPAFVTQTLKEWDGKLARFVGDGSQPAEVYDVAVASLPAEAQQQLAGGIVVTSEEQLLSLLENFTS